MAIRHKAVKATLERGYASEWNDDHHLDPTDEIIFWNTFAEQILSAYWETGQSTGGATVTTVLVDNHFFCNCISGAGVGDIATIRKKAAGIAGDMTDPDDLPIMTTAIRLVTPAGAGTTHEFGLFTSATVPFTANQHGAYFRVAANVLYAVTGTGAAETTTNLGAPNEYGVYRIEITSTNVKFYVDDLTSPMATHTTNMPTGNLTMKLSSIGVAAGSQVLRSDFVGLVRLRKQ
jgi:hypothetical protein